MKERKTERAREKKRTKSLLDSLMQRKEHLDWT